MRERCDLSHQVLTCSDIGRLVGFGRIPVIAGDSISTESVVSIRLAQLRRPLTVDIKVDLFAFYCPYRFTYGEDWRDYIQNGGQEGVTFGTITASVAQSWLLMNDVVMPEHVYTDAVSIFNNFFKDPSEASMSLTPLTGINRYRGPLCYHLKGWGTAQSFLASGSSGEFNAPVVAAEVSVFDIQTAAFRTKQKNFRDYISSRYVEIMRDMSGMNVSDSSDDRPELLWRESHWMSGYDINGTAGAEFGLTTGKAVSEIQFRMPPRAFAEHGTVYFFALCRMPPVFDQMRHYLDTFNRPFEDVVPGPSAFEPKDLLMSDVFATTSSSSLGFVSRWDWYRTHPSFVNDAFNLSDTGWQFLDEPQTPLAAIQCGNYDDMFQGALPTRQYTLNCSHRISAMRPLPSQDSSMFGVG